MVVHVRVGNLLRHGYGVCQLHVSGVVASDGYGVDGPQTVVVIYVAGLFIGLVRVKVDENTVETPGSKPVPKSAVIPAFSNFSLYAHCHE